VLVTTKTPLRVSFLGGGTDYPDFSENELGRVLGTAINLYVYISILPNNVLSTPGFRLNYSVHEDVQEVSQFRHPVVREILTSQEIGEKGLAISTLADAPARSGLGSSSAFTVGLLTALSKIRGEQLGVAAIADAAVEIERVRLNEPGGFQDQYHAAFGGFNLFEFRGRKVTSQKINNPFAETLNDSMYLVAVGDSRDSHEHAESTKNFAKTMEGRILLSTLSSLTNETHELLQQASSGSKFLETLAWGMKESWRIKKAFSGAIVNNEIDSLISLGLISGALAGKLCGAGGSGFILFLVPKENQNKFENAFSLRKYKKIKISLQGTSIL
jgi:D-glycero-alpha-D-manno-heptose-7-phosphate kinase